MDESNGTPDGVEVTGPNTWAVSTPDSEGLVTYTLLAGPGIPGIVSAR